MDSEDAGPEATVEALMSGTVVFPDCTATCPAKYFVKWNKQFPDGAMSDAALA